MSSNYSKDSFDRFGDDLCQLLLSYLTFKERFRCECISRQWHRLVFTTQLDLIIDHNFIDIVNDKQMFESIVKKCANITRVCDITKCFYKRPVNDLLIELLVKHCNHLNDININLIDLSVQTFDQFMAKFGKQLTKITFRSVGVNWHEMCVNLHTIDYPIDITRVSSLLINGQNEMQFKRLQDIQLVVNHSTVDLNTFDLFANLYKNNIKTIALHLKCDINDDITNKLSDILSRMKRLIGLKMMFTNNFEDVCKLLSLIGPKCPQLTSLYISFYRSTVGHLFETIGTSFKRLKRLEVRASLAQGMNVTTDSMNTLKGLTHLTLCLSTNIKNQFFVNISSHLPLIQHLAVDGVIITSVALEELLRLKYICTVSLDGDIAVPGTYLLNKLPIGFDLNGLTFDI